MFARIVHCDWSKHPGGRWGASACRTPSGWRVAGPWPVGDVAGFVDGLVSEATERPTLAAFDFPIGLPEAYGGKIGLPGFRAALDAFGGPGWTSWFEPAVGAEDIGVGRPFYPAKPGAAKVEHLLDGLGVAAIGDLMRATERGGPGLKAAGCMFWLVGAKTVGKAAIHGWTETIRPALARGAKLWPFDGDLDELAARGGLVLAESYPGDAAMALGLTVVGKGDPLVLKALASDLRAWANARQIGLSADLVSDIESGFARHGKRCGDAFDAVIGLLAAIAVANGEHSEGAPHTEAVRTWEGWILGRRGRPGSLARPARSRPVARPDRPGAPGCRPPAEEPHA